MKERVCTICKCKKPATRTFFAPDKRRTKGLQSHCRLCGRAFKKKHSDEMRQKIARYKLSCGCNDCGYDSHHAALEFDHVKGSKRFCISNMTRCLWTKILSEIKKCEVVCSNCHKIRTWERLQG